MAIKITVVTVCLNAEKFIEQTIASVAGQTYENTEFIIVDGNSTDNTLELIKKNEAVIDKWISEPDSGIADAMNKGIALSSGDFLLFLNADDYLYSNDALQQCVSQIENECKIAAFNIIFSRTNGTSFTLKPRGFNWWNNFKMGVYHQGVLCHREVFEKVGNFDTQFRLALDYDLFLRAHKCGIDARPYDVTLSIMRDTGISSRLDWASLRYRFSEEKRVHEKNCRSTLLRYCYGIYWFLYPKYRLTRHLLSGVPQQLSKRHHPA
jgi:glycosyltransferase involved in cell wall biosynthesis